MCVCVCVCSVTGFMMTIACLTPMLYAIIGQENTSSALTELVKSHKGHTANIRAL